MTKTGRLIISVEVSCLNGTVLARKGAPNPFSAATDFLDFKDCHTGDCVTVTGENGIIGEVSVIFIDSAKKVAETLCI